MYLVQNKPHTHLDGRINKIKKKSVEMSRINWMKNTMPRLLHEMLLHFFVKNCWHSFVIVNAREKTG